MADPPSKPAPPTLDGNEEDARGETFLKVKWSSADNAVRYKVYCNSEVQEFSEPTVPFKTEFNSLPSNTIHDFKVDAFNSDGDVATSDVVSFFTRPKAPSFLRLVANELSINDTSINVIWEVVSSVPRYVIYIDNIRTQESPPPDASGSIISSLQPNTLYKVSIKSLDPAKGGLSSSSSPVLIVRTRPPEPKILNSNVEPGNAVSISIQDIPSFNIEAGQLTFIEVGTVDNNSDFNPLLEIPSLTPGKIRVSISNVTPIKFGARTKVNLVDGTINLSKLAQAPNVIASSSIVALSFEQSVLAKSSDKNLMQIARFNNHFL